MRTRHGITQVRGFKRILHASQFQSFLDEHPEAKKRWNVLRPIFDKTITIEAAADVFKLSERSIRRWKNEWNPDSWYSLLPKSRSPKTTPRRLTPLERKQRVVAIANDRLAWGAPKIWAYIRQEDPLDQHIGKRTVSRILAQGLLSEEIVPRVKLKALVHHRRDVRGRTINRVKNSTDPASAPGERVHCDGVIVQIFLAAEGVLRKLYFSNTIDRFSKLAMVVVGEHLVPALTIASHQALGKILGEPIKEKINDNGSENLGACIEYYEGENIVQLFTYPHAPKQNAVAERFNRTFQEECLLGRRIDLTQSIEIIQEQINAWLVEYNTERPHEGIDNMTPIRKLVAWKFAQLPKDRQADPLCGQMLWRGTTVCRLRSHRAECPHATGISNRRVRELSAIRTNEGSSRRIHEAGTGPPSCTRPGDPSVHRLSPSDTDLGLDPREEEAVSVRAVRGRRVGELRGHAKIKEAICKPRRSMAQHHRPRQSPCGFLRTCSGIVAHPHRRVYVRCSRITSFPRRQSSPPLHVRGRCQRSHHCSFSSNEKRHGCQVRDGNTSSSDRQCR